MLPPISIIVIRINITGRSGRFPVCIWGVLRGSCQITVIAVSRRRRRQRKAGGRAGFRETYPFSMTPKRWAESLSERGIHEWH